MDKGKREICRGRKRETRDKREAERERDKEIKLYRFTGRKKEKRNDV